MGLNMVYVLSYPPMMNPPNNIYGSFLLRVPAFGARI